MSPGTCIHFTGIGSGGCCRAGVNYADAFDGTMAGIMFRLPCMQFRVVAADGRSTSIRAGEPEIRKEIDRRDQQMIPCALYLEPTPEQVQTDRAEKYAALNRTFAAIKVAQQWRVNPKPRQDRREVIECPVCKGKLHLAQSCYNGHVRGKCETKGCVSWME